MFELQSLEYSFSIKNIEIILDLWIVAISQIMQKFFLSQLKYISSRLNSLTQKVFKSQPFFLIFI